MDGLSDLEIFTTVVEEGSFVRASATLNLTPSAVSKRISRYENRLGTRLLNRTTRALSLTESGQNLYARGKTILEEVAQAELASKHGSVTPTGNVRISCSDAFALHVLVPTLPSFRALYPDISITILQGDGPIDMIRERVDLAIRFEAPTNQDFVSMKLLPDPWVVCATPQYIATHGAPKHPRDLQHHPCLTIRARDSETNQWQFVTNGQPIHVDINSTLSGIGLVMKQAALNNLGVARLAHFLIKDCLDDGSLMRLLKDFEPTNSRHIHAVYPNRQFVPMKVTALVDHLRERLITAHAT
ncbi:MAG: LysR family transcriptional regulator [Pseudomonadota bacterium]